MATDFKAEYAAAAARLERELDALACVHADRVCELDFNGRRYRYCDACSFPIDAALERHRAARADIRKRQLDAMPRCEYCARRATWRLGAGDALDVCGRHRTQIERAARAAAPGALLGLLNLGADDLRAIADGIGLRTRLVGAA